MRRLSLFFYAALILGFSGKSVLFNTWDLLQQKLPQYHVNATLLSGTLLLYDRPMFFESRQIEIKEQGSAETQVMAYDLKSSAYQSYVERRLFRMATNEFPCGGNREVAFEELFCRGNLNVLKGKSVESVTVRFTPHLSSGHERIFTHECSR